MAGPSKHRKDILDARRIWTERLNRFAEAKTAKQRQAAIEPALKINPGGTIRDLLQAWGYSAASRGRKAKGEETEKKREPARQKLEQTLEKLYGKKPTPVPSLYKKLSGHAPTSVKDACRIVSALVSSWPEPLSSISKTLDDAAHGVKGFAKSFIRELLSNLSGGRSHGWSANDMEVRVFNLIDEVRMGITEFIKDAGEKEGALIVAGARTILLGPDPIDTIRLFHNVTSNFIGNNHKGLLIFVFDAALFEAGEDAYRLLYNLGLLSMAMTAFAIFEEQYVSTLPIRQHKVDWSRWRSLSSRCCVIIRRPTVIDPSTGELLKGKKLDEFIASWLPKQEFARLEDLKGFIRFDGSHVLPRTYPTPLSENQILSGRDLYWDILVRPSPSRPDDLEVLYFTPPIEEAFPISKVTEAPQRTRGRPGSKFQTIEEEVSYLIRQGSPGHLFDDAQRAIFMASRGRLNLDNGTRHEENLNAAAALRQIGYEVLPISVMLSLFPRSLHFAAVEKQRTGT